VAKDVIMPALGMAQETGTLLTWHKQEGETVTKGELLMTVATDKTDVDIEANASGILAQVTAKPGDEVPVGQPIALILTPEEAANQTASKPVAPLAAAGEVASGSAQPPAAAVVSATPVAARLAAERGVDLRLVKAGAGGKIQKEDVLAFLAGQEKPPAPTNGRALASPKARRLASEGGINLTTLRGSGPDGAVLAADVLSAQTAAAASGEVAQAAPLAPTMPVEPAAGAPAGASAVGEIVPMSRPWRIMAQRLQQSWTTVPHFYLAREVNCSGLVRWREGVQGRSKSKITVTDLLVKLVAAALRLHPRVNAAWLKEEIVLNQEINIGLAVAVEDGLLVPVVPHADRLGLGEIAACRATLVEKAQSGKLTPDELSGGTFTISNLGMYGIDQFNAIVNPPQAAILAVGRIADKVVPLNGQPAVQPMMTLTLSCDHRVVDGARAAQFMQTLVGYIEDPLSVLD
jgi:pyruvate dehydrogenase E2 component (dihydrolipoamide acetyltransferase)